MDEGRFFINPTVDVEGVHGKDPFNQMILGHIDSGESWGVFKIAELFERYRIKATFFIDIYEYTFWGEDRIRTVCEKLLEMGQDVQLHTHPGWRMDPLDFKEIQEMKLRRSYMSHNKDMMAKLSFEEQVSVLSHGIEKLCKWTGQEVVAHRSGGYSINADTIQALKAVGILVDSSMNAAHQNSELTWSKNNPTHKDGITELPVTLIDLVAFLPRNIKGKPYRKRIKTDLDALTLQELEYFISQGISKKLAYMNLFMHSYSLLKFDIFYRSFDADHAKYEKLEALIDKAISNSNIQFIACCDAINHSEFKQSIDQAVDFVPSYRNSTHIFKLGLNKIKNLTMEKYTSGIVLNRYR